MNIKKSNIISLSFYIKILEKVNWSVPIISIKIKIRHVRVEINEIENREMKWRICFFKDQ